MKSYISILEDYTLMSQDTVIISVFDYKLSHQNVQITFSDLKCYRSIPEDYTFRFQKSYGSKDLQFRYVEVRLILFLKTNCQK
jgi:hypothetical protein